MKRFLVPFFIVLTLFYFSCSSDSDDGNSVPSELQTELDNISLENPIPNASPVSGKTAAEIVKAMGAGWNMGNTLDACKDTSSDKMGLESETYWGMPKTSKATIDAVAKAGFTTIRIPISWHNHYSDGQINSEWMERVKQIVDWALEDNLYVVMNIHHDTWNGSGSFWGYSLDSSHKDNSIEYIKNIWSQVAAKFANYDQRLIFETMNEPRLRGDQHEWWYDASCSKCNTAMEILNELNQIAINAIRTGGGNNSSRLIIVPSMVASPDAAFNANFKLPTDSSNMTALSVHMYTPYVFAMESPGDTKFTDAHKENLSYYFNKLNSDFIAKEIPVFIGEYGATNKNNKAERIAWVQYFISGASIKGMATALWDNNNYKVIDNNYNEHYGYMNRANGTWYDEEFIKMIMLSK